MMEYFIEGVGSWGRSRMIETGVPEDVVDMYVERSRRELKDVRHQIYVTVYNLLCANLC